MAFVKLDTGILDSTLWVDKDAREIFITGLLMALPKTYDDHVQEIEIQDTKYTGYSVPAGDYGFIAAASVGIIRRAGVDRERGIKAIERLASPEVDSRSPDFDGRRMIRVDGGFLVLNFQKYRDKDHTSAARARRYRERKRNAVTQRSNTVTPPRVTQAEAEAYTEADINRGAWDLYEIHRRELKAKKLTDRGRRMAQKKLASLSADGQMTVVELSIANGWVGLFPEKLKSNGSHKETFDDKLARLDNKAGLS